MVKEPKYIRNFIEDYCWIVGLVLFTGGLVLLKPYPLILIFLGLIVTAIGAYLRGGRE